MNIESDHLVEGRPVLARDLPEPGQTRQRAEALPLPRRISFELAGQARARSNEAQVPRITCISCGNSSKPAERSTFPKGMSRVSPRSSNLVIGVLLSMRLAVWAS